MAERDFHFKYENSIPVKKKKKPKNPAPPINAKRNPSAEPEEYSEFDEAQPEVKENEAGEVYIDLEENAKEEKEAVKVYEPKRFREETPEETQSRNERSKFFVAALIMAVIGILFVAVGIFIAFTYL